jgi:hypothetical protein
VLVQNQQQLDELDKQVAIEQTRNAKLELAHATAESPQRIVAEATKAGMVPALDKTYVAPSPAVAAAAAQTAGGADQTTSVEQPDAKADGGSGR